MKRITLERMSSTDEGTFGRLSVEDSRFSAFTMEPPEGLPKGQYLCRKDYALEEKAHYKILNVPPWHGKFLCVAEWAGDQSKGYHSQMAGGIALGNAITRTLPPGKNKAQKALAGNTETTRQFIQELRYANIFLLTIR